MDLDRLQGLGGKAGVAVKTWMVKAGLATSAEEGCTLGALAAVPLPQLSQQFGHEMGKRLYEMCRGEWDEPVCDRAENQSLGASKVSGCR